MAAAAGAPREQTAAEAKAAIRAWVTGADERRFASLAEGTVLCQVTHSNLRQNIIELRLDLHATVRATKEMLYTYNGTNIEFMELQLFSGDTLVARMLDDSKKLGFYGLTHGHRVHVVDHDPMSLSRGGGLDDVSQVTKYRMSDEDYDKREGTLRAWKREQLKTNPHFKYSDALPGAEPSGPPVDFSDPELVKDVKVGMRCKVRPGERRGEVAFVGAVEGKTGLWVGVRLDEPLGRGDGTANGVRYFEAEPKYGTFMRGTAVETGDFPPLSLDEELGLDDGADASAAGAAAAPAESAVEETKEADTPSKTGTAGAETRADDAKAEAAAREAQTAKRAMARPSALRRRPGDDDFGDDDDDDEL